MKSIILITKEEEIESFSTLTGVCQVHKDFKYNYIKRLKFPFVYKGYRFQRLDVYKFKKL